MNIYYIWLAYLSGSVTVYVIMRSMVKHSKRRNAELMAESDYHFMMMKLLYKTLSSEQQKEVETGREKRMINAQYQQNKEKIQRTGTY